jgi:hypothetical protein
MTATEGLQKQTHNTYFQYELYTNGRKLQYFVTYKI